MIVSHLKINPNLRMILKDDPVRPTINPEIRFGSDREVLTLQDPPLSEDLAVLCVAWMNHIPTTEENLFFSWGSYAIMYSLWNLKRGSGIKMAQEGVKYLKLRKATRIITLSPKTEMAKKFHLHNGASLLWENETTYNFEYEV
jgi:hypothetical protein